MSHRRIRGLATLSVPRPSGRALAVLGILVLLAGLANVLIHREIGSPEPAWTTTRDASIRGQTGRQKVVFIVIDALRADHLGMNGYHRQTSPTLDRLAAQGLLFRPTIVQAPQTVPSVLSMLTSLLPSEHGIQYDGRTGRFGGNGEMGAPAVGDQHVLMAQLFAAAGYYTAAFVANPWLRARYGFARGFAEYAELDEGDGRYLVQGAQQLLREHRSEKTFVYLHFMDVHSPYAGFPADFPGPRPPFERPRTGRYRYTNGQARTTSPADLAYTMALYDEGIFYVDRLVSRLVDFLTAEDLLRDTTIVVVSDHGDEFMDHGGLGHGTTLNAELIDSFLLVWSPTRLPTPRVGGCARGIDVLPTLLGLQGIEAPTGLEGRSLLDPGAESACRAEAISELANQKSLIARGWKLVRRVSTGEERLEFVGDDGIPDTQPPALAPGVREAMRRRIDEVVQRASRSRSVTTKIDTDDEARLRRLGYLR